MRIKTRARKSAPAMDGDEWENRVRSAAREIERYLESHPQAADSLEGIAAWWIARQRIHVELRVVRAALARLAEAGLVASLRPRSCQGPIYRLTR